MSRLSALDLAEANAGMETEPKIAWKTDDLRRCSDLR